MVCEICKNFVTYKTNGFVSCFMIKSYFGQTKYFKYDLDILHGLDKAIHFKCVFNVG